MKYLNGVYRATGGLVQQAVLASEEQQEKWEQGPGGRSKEFIGCHLERIIQRRSVQ